MTIYQELIARHAANGRCWLNLDSIEQKVLYINYLNTEQLPEAYRVPCRNTGKILDFPLGTLGHLANQAITKVRDNQSPLKTAERKTLMADRDERPWDFLLFGTSDGYCTSCSADLVSHFRDRWPRVDATGCPKCNRSWCE